jgi:hypothetical protein
MKRRALLVCVAVLVAACGPKPIPPPPAAPHVTAAAELIPPDLDVVVRLDLGRVKAALGAAALSALAGEVLARGKADAGADDLVVSSLLEADLVYFDYLRQSAISSCLRDLRPMLSRPRIPVGSAAPASLLVGSRKPCVCRQASVRPPARSPTSRRATQIVVPSSSMAQTPTAAAKSRPPPTSCESS